MEEINSNTVTNPVSPPESPKRPFFKKPIGYVVLVIILVTILFTVGSFVLVRDSRKESAVNLEQKKVEVMARLDQTNESPLSAKEKADIVNFVSDPSAASTFSEEEAARLIEELRKDGNWEWRR